MIDGFAAGKPPKPGPQIDRQFSAPVGGPTTLTDKAIYETASAGGDNGGAALTDNKAKKPTQAASEREVARAGIKNAETETRLIAQKSQNAC